YADGATRGTGPGAARAGARRASGRGLSRPRSVRGPSQRAGRRGAGPPVPGSVLIRSARRLEDVADAADRVDQRRPAGVDLLPQVTDVQLDHVRLAAEVVVPDPVEDLRLGQHPARVAHEGPQ